MITTEERGRVGVVRIDRHEQRNALDIEHCEQLRDALGDVHAAGARAVVITGQGSSFCAGADFGEVYGDGFRKALYEMLRRIITLPVPVLAAVNGPAIGAGAQLALAADLRMVAPTASFAIPTAKLGLAVDPWTIRRLALLAGGGQARRILLTCEPLSADEALACGLADAAGDLEAALERAARIGGLAPLTLAYSKQALNRFPELDVADAVVEALFGEVWRSADVAEGRAARQERRAPRFEGR
ncbi:MAG TPA: enoyl-CoA hydratase [Acidimicrobiia bacterium]|nr:enoyl-CoA hydratase [Acidimicrobiia bacterium]